MCKQCEPAVILTQVSVQTWMNIYYQMNWVVSQYGGKEDGVLITIRRMEFTQTASLLSSGITGF